MSKGTYSALLEAIKGGIEAAQAKRSAPDAVDWRRYQHDPLGLARDCWPHVSFYDKQRHIIESVRDCNETFVVAANQVGKDFTAAFCVLHGFLTHPEARIVTTSVKGDHLRVLWGEINRFITTARLPLLARDGGPLVVNHREIKKVGCEVSYVLGTVSERGEGLQGHHAPYTLGVIDEASAADDLTFEMMGTWAKRKLIFGNPLPCQSFFKRGVKGGDVPSGEGGHPFRRVIKIAATDSPNVLRELLRQQGTHDAALPPETPGVLSWDEYQTRLATWDEVRRTIGLSAEFWEGQDALLFPPLWLDHAEALARKLASTPRQAKGVGLDAAEGGDKTAFAAVDEHGLIELVSKRTPDTWVIASDLLAFCRRHNVPASSVCIDRGGGGKQIADRLRNQGFAARTVAFGEAVTPDPQPFGVRHADKVRQREERYAYFNRRAQMYHDLRLLLDPSGEKGGWAIPAQYSELRRQLAPIPLQYDSEGRVRLLPKQRSAGRTGEKTLTDLIGCSPDDADATCLACHAMLHPERVLRAGGIIL